VPGASTNSNSREKRIALLAMVALVLVSFVSSGCRMFRGKPKPAQVQIGSLVFGTNISGHPEAMEVLEGQIMRFADNYAAMVAQAVDDYCTNDIGIQARIEAARWKLGQATAAYIDASGPNPALNALDLVVLVTISRIVLEDEVPRYFGEKGEPILITQRRLETNAWAALSVVLNPEQQQQLRDMIHEWRERNPNQRYAAVARFRELAIAVGQAPQQSETSPTSIFSLLYLDPFSGLDPTAAAIQETRQMAERAMYYSQRLPALLNWQVQLTTLLLASQPESQQLLGDAERLTRSMESFSKLADEFPKLLEAQREAAIRQTLEGLAAERTNWLASLAYEEEKTRALLAEARQTATAAGQMAEHVDAAIKSLDGFVRYVSPPKTNSHPESTNSHPFDVRDYGNAASQVGVAAKDLNGLLLTVNQNSPQLTAQMAATTRQTLQQAFWLGLTLIAIFLVGIVLAGVIYQVVVRKLNRAGSASAAGSGSRVAGTPD
jgi:hypothetical protein